jgi:hypothetical protein
VTRFSVACLCLLVALATVPARAETGGVIVVSRSQYLPGDDELVPAVAKSGAQLDFQNHDYLSFGSTHSITSDIPDLFNSGVIQAGQEVLVDIPALPTGTYGFHCSVHTDTMHGTLIIV